MLERLIRVSSSIHDDTLAKSLTLMLFKPMQIATRTATNAARNPHLDVVEPDEELFTTFADAMTVNLGWMWTSSEGINVKRRKRWCQEMNNEKMGR